MVTNKLLKAWHVIFVHASGVIPRFGLRACQPREGSNGADDDFSRLRRPRPVGVVAHLVARDMAHPGSPWLCDRRSLLGFLPPPLVAAFEQLMPKQKGDFWTMPWLRAIARNCANRVAGRSCSIFAELSYPESGGFMRDFVEDLQR